MPDRTYPTPDALAHHLRAHGLDLTPWGHGAAKTIADLWRELHTGDATLDPAPLHRRVAVVELWIRRGDRVLIEADQHLQDGRTRPRRRLPAEKMRPGEPPAEAALRCLAEEMAIAPARVTLGRVLPPRLRTTDSPSYPGLPSTYAMHRVEATVAGLPDEDFTTAEAHADANDPVSHHHWRWVPLDAITDD
ncbi:MAG: NUDIX hydrolase [bacterium]|nr:NUDIX hydrolase [Myxococcales bacterium]MCB9541125.1 NUDIX hydrolase [Myxococcales bacterium]MCB9551685.1 NUDIX hydrolase [Myxococcales bacterium]